MGLFGFKKVNNKDSNIFINNDVINAPDYANMPQNTVTGYQDTTQTTPNNEIATSTEQNNLTESYSYSVDNSNTYENEYTNQTSDVIMTVNKDDLAANQQYYQSQYNQEGYPSSYTQNEFGGGQQEFSDNQYIYNEANVNQDNQYPPYEMPQLAYPEQEFSGTQTEFSTNETSYVEQNATYPTYGMPQVANPEQVFNGTQPEFSTNETSYVEQNATYPTYEMPQVAYPEQEFGGAQPEFSAEQQNYYDNTVPAEQSTEYNTQQTGYIQSDNSANQYNYNTMPNVNTEGQEFSGAPEDYNTAVYPETNVESATDETTVSSLIPEHTLESITKRKTSNDELSQNPETSEAVGEESNSSILEPITTGDEEFVSQSVPGQESTKQVEKTELQQYYDDEDNFIIFDEEEGPDLNISNVIKLFIDMLKQPFSTLTENIKKYTKISNSLLLTMWVTLFSIALCLVGRIIAGIITPTINPISGARKITIGISNLLKVSNYLPYIIGILLFGLGTILIVALIYYIASFIFSKGIHFSVYLATSALSTIPLIVSFTIAHPIINILSSKLALAIFIFGLALSLILFISSINVILHFKTKDIGTIYHAINVTIIALVMTYIINILAEQRIFDIFQLLR